MKPRLITRAVAKLDSHRSNFRAAIFSVFTTGLLILNPAKAGIIGINGANSIVQFKFDDTTSLDANSNLGTLLLTTTQTPWAGNPLGLNLVAPITNDTSGFTINGFGFVGPATIYRVNIPNFYLTQPATGAGFAQATLEFHIEYQVDGSGFTGPLIAPQFMVSGTVLTPASFSSLIGHVDYSSAANGLLETLNYVYANSTPGAFSQFLLGLPVNNVTSLTFAPFDTFIESGFFKLHVDPASITLSSIPVPSTTALFVVTLLGTLAIRRRRRSRLIS